MLALGMRQNQNVFMQIKISQENLPLAKFMAGEASRLGLRLYAVGGCVRDWILGSRVQDIDFLASGPSDGLAEAVIARYGGKWQKFGSFQTARCLTEKAGRIDIARFRRETYAAPAALPQTMPADTVEQDLLRRDFTVNAMAAELTGMDGALAAITDISGGLEDLRSGIVRVLHKNSFRDDPTRIYRAARFAARFGWRLAPDTEEQAMQAVRAGLPGLLSRERLRNELAKMLAEDNPARSLEMAAHLGAADFIFPGMNAMAGRFGEIFAPGNNPPVPEQAEAAGGNAAVMRRFAALAQAIAPAGADFIVSLRLSKKQSREIASIAGITLLGKH